MNNVLTKYAKFNIFVPNSHVFKRQELVLLDNFDYVLCKSKYNLEATECLSKVNNIWKEIKPDWSLLILMDRSRLLLHNIFCLIFI